MKTKSLTPKQQCFVEEYLVDLNATQAAIRAGYSEKTAEQQGARLLGNVKVRAAIDAGKQARTERTETDQDKVLQELKRLVYSDVRACFNEDGSLKPITEWPDEAAAAVSSIEVVTKLGAFKEDGSREVDHVHKIKVWDKNSAIDKLMKHLAMFVERHEHTGKGGKDLPAAAATVVILPAKLPVEGEEQS